MIFPLMIFLLPSPLSSDANLSVVVQFSPEEPTGTLNFLCPSASVRCPGYLWHLFWMVVTCPGTSMFSWYPLSGSSLQSVESTSEHPHQKSSGYQTPG